MSILNIFQKPDTNAKAMFRWWFPDAGADLEKVKAQMKEMYDGGFGGVEVTMVPQFTDFDPCGEYAWGTPRWRELVKTILKTAAEMPGEFKVDFHAAPHWPSTSPDIVPNDDVQVQELIGSFEKLGRTSKGMVRIPMPDIRTNDNDAGDAADYIFQNKFVGLTIAQVAEVDGVNFKLVWESMKDVSYLTKEEVDPATGEAVWTPAGIPLHETKFGDKPKLRDRQLYYVADRDQLPASGDDDEEIRPGDWLLFGFWRRGSGQSVSGRQFEVFSLSLPFGPKCYTINGWDPAGPSIMPKLWERTILNDPEVVDLLKQVGAATDSCFKGAEGLGGETIGLWSASYTADFFQVNGYDVMPYLPFLAYHDYELQFCPYLYKYFMTADNGNDERILEDFFKTSVWIHEERCWNYFKNWADQFGYGVRLSGMPPLGEGNTVGLKADQCEGATLLMRWKMDNQRDLVSGIHVADKKIMAAEANADELMPYRLTFKNVAEKLNACYAAGLNLAIFHGASFDEEVSGKFNQWPGWHAFQFSFAGAWGRRHPWWSGVRYLSDYLARVQGVLQSGTVKIDLLGYEPIRNTQEVWDGAAAAGDYNKLIAHGYSYDLGGEQLITDPHIALKNGRLGPDGPAYKALIMRSCTYTTMPVLEHMISLAEAGFPVISVGDTPTRTRGLSGAHGITDEMIVATMERLAKAPGYHHVDDEDGLLAKLQELNIQPDLPYDAPGVSNIQRRDRDSSWFYLFNNSGETASIPVSPEKGYAAYVADPWSGEITKCTAASMKLLSGAARFLVYARPETYPADLPEYTVPGEKVADLTDFTLKIDSWGPAGDPKDPCLSRHTILNMGSPDLGHWDAMEGPVDDLAEDGLESMYDVSGIGTYATTYISDCKKKLYLVTESAEDQIVGIYVNGIEQQRPDAVARYSMIELNEGENEIEINLASTLRRRVNRENPFFTENDFELMFGGNLDNPSATAAPDPATTNHYGLTAVKLYTVQ